MLWIILVCRMSFKCWCDGNENFFSLRFERKKSNPNTSDSRDAWKCQKNVLEYGILAADAYRHRQYIDIESIFLFALCDFNHTSTYRNISNDKKAIFFSFIYMKLLFSGFFFRWLCLCVYHYNKHFEINKKKKKISI